MILNASNARQNFFSMIEKVIGTHVPVTVSSKHGNVIIISEEDYQAIQETLYLLSVPGMRESIVEGMQASPDECTRMEDLDW